jgi:hypothetical protein
VGSPVLFAIFAAGLRGRRKNKKERAHMLRLTRRQSGESWSARAAQRKKYGRAIDNAILTVMLSVILTVKNDCQNEANKWMITKSLAERMTTGRKTHREIHCQSIFPQHHGRVHQSAPRSEPEFQVHTKSFFTRVSVRPPNLLLQMIPCYVENMRHFRAMNTSY